MSVYLEIFNAVINKKSFIYFSVQPCTSSFTTTTEENPLNTHNDVYYLMQNSVLMPGTNDRKGKSNCNIRAQRNSDSFPKFLR